MWQASRLFCFEPQALCLLKVIIGIRYARVSCFLERGALLLSTLLSLFLSFLHLNANLAPIQSLFFCKTALLRKGNMKSRRR